MMFSIPLSKKSYLSAADNPAVCNSLVRVKHENCRASITSMLNCSGRDLIKWRGGGQANYLNFIILSYDN